MARSIYTSAKCARPNSPCEGLGGERTTHEASCYWPRIGVLPRTLRAKGLGVDRTTHEASCYCLRMKASPCRNPCDGAGCRSNDGRAVLLLPRREGVRPNA